MTTNLRTTIHQLKTHVTDFFGTFDGYKTSAHQRSKRSNILGTFAARILGLATDTDLKLVIHIVNKNLHKEEGVINRTVSTITITETHLRKVVKAINKANLAMTSMKNHFQKLEKNFAQLDSAFVLAEALTFFTASVDTIDRTVRRTLLDLLVRLTGKISSSLLSPTRLQTLLRDVQNFQLSLVFPPTLNYSPSYFRICQAIVKMSKLDFYIIVRVPLQTDSSYELFRLRSFAVPYGNSKWSRRISDLPTYLGMRDDRKVAVVMNDLANCISASDRFMCSPYSHFVSTTQQTTCPIALFQNSKEIDKVCDFMYAYDLPTEFVKISNRWVGTSHSPQKVEEVCHNHTRSFSIPAGITSIPMIAGCKIISDDFVLPPFGLQGTTNLTIDILSHPYNLTPLEHLSLQPLAKIKLQQLMPFKASDLDFLKLQQAIYPAGNWTSVNSSHFALTVIIIIGLIAVAVYLTFLKCRSRMLVTNVHLRTSANRRNCARFSPLNLLSRIAYSFSTSC